MNTSNFVSIPATMFEDQEILVFDEHRLTYGQLWQNIQRLANALRGLGVERGDCVAVLQVNSHRYVEAYYATAAIGAVFLANQLPRQVAGARVHDHHGERQGAARR